MCPHAVVHVLLHFPHHDSDQEKDHAHVMKQLAVASSWISVSRVGSAMQNSMKFARWSLSTLTSPEAYTVEQTFSQPCEGASTLCRYQTRKSSFPSSACAISFIPWTPSTHMNVPAIVRFTGSLKLIEKCSQACFRRTMCCPQGQSSPAWQEPASLQPLESSHSRHVHTPGAFSYITGLAHSLLSTLSKQSCSVVSPGSGQGCQHLSSMDLFQKHMRMLRFAGC